MSLSSGPNIDRLLEEGLTKYGSGDLDGALHAWEEVLALEPDHEQAKSYIQYVRSNYDVLANGKTERATEGNSAPFPVFEEPEYQIEVSGGGELPAANAPVRHDSNDEGWLVEESTNEAATVMRPRKTDAPEQLEPAESLELDDEPEIEFETATREYQGSPANPDHGDAPDFEAEVGTSTFRSEESTGSFGSEASGQTTNVHKRDLGFVQPSAELNVRIRTPAPSAQPARPKTPSVVSVGKAPTQEVSEGARDAERAFLGEAPTAERLFGGDASAPDDSEGAALESVESVKRDTMDLPEKPRPPASTGRLPKVDPDAVSQAEVVLSAATTKELDRPVTVEPEQAVAQVERDLMISAPTRELGLRQTTRAPTSDDTPTREADVRSFREQHARQGADTARELPATRGTATPRAVGADTKHDAVLPVDPAIVRDTEILAEVDEGASPSEPIEDRTRRRISRLCERAVVWNAEQDFDKAFAAIDLALSEDPGSALAQKLVHRNRDAIMTVFQSYLGSLERTPQLAQPLHELANAPIGPRAAFLLSRVDGQLTIDEVLDVSGMPRMEAFRYLCQLYQRGILK